jgi:hypothetical protein
VDHNIYPREEAEAIENFDTWTASQWSDYARRVSTREVADRIIARAMLTPYFHLDGYMNRYWLFNPHQALSGGEGREYPDMASVRIHHILRADHERHHHNHPWDARTIILKGWYDEVRAGWGQTRRTVGDTAEINADTFHTIHRVSPGGVWTMFFMGRKAQTWGFKTEGGFVNWREYLGVPEGVEG